MSQTLQPPIIGVVRREHAPATLPETIQGVHKSRVATNSGACGTRVCAGNRPIVMLGSVQKALLFLTLWVTKESADTVYAKVSMSHHAVVPKASSLCLLLGDRRLLSEVSRVSLSSRRCILLFFFDRMLLRMMQCLPRLPSNDHHGDDEDMRLLL